MMSFQARLTDNGGNPLPNGPHTLDFFIYGSETGGSIIGSILNVQVTLSGGNGVVSQPIGPVQEAWFADAPRFMGITIDDNDDNPAGNELTPRIRLTATPFAMRAFGLPTTTSLNIQSANITGQMTAAGMVGLGTASPLAQLHVHSNANNNYAAIISNGGGDGGGLLIQAGAATPIATPLLQIKDNNGNDYFKVTPNGKIGIGTLQP